MKKIVKISAIVVVGMLICVNFSIMMSMMADVPEEEHPKIFVEDRDGNQNGYYTLDKRGDGKYDLEIWTIDPEANVEIEGLYKPPRELHVRIDSAVDDPAVKYVFYIDPVDIERAVVTLPRSGIVSEILYCANFDSQFFKGDEWSRTQINFGQEEASVTFEVQRSGGYGVVEELNTYTVTTTLDSGEGSLRRALFDANENIGVDKIVFNIHTNDENHYYYKDDKIPGHVTLENRRTTKSPKDSWISDIDPDYPHSWWSIKPASALPIIVYPIIIDGYTQNGALENSQTESNDAKLKIELDGTDAGMPLGGFHLNGGDSMVRGFAIHSFGLCGIQIDVNGNNVIEGNYIGTDVSGTNALGNFIGVNVHNSSGNRIGGEEPASANVISGNHLTGVLISGESARSNIVQGNFLSSDATGTKSLANGASGVWVSEEVETENAVQDNFIMDDLKTQMVFFDTSVSDYMRLMAGVTSYEYLTSGDYLTSIEIVILDTSRDGVEQITEEIADKSDVTGIHILSHGSSGSLTLGNTVLSASNIDSYESQLTSWQKALSDGADILLYGCDVAKGGQGMEFVEKLGELTGADIAASNDPTGSEELGGDWELEFTVGEIETSLPFSSDSLNGYEHILGYVIYYGYNLTNYKNNPKISTHVKHSFVNGLRELGNVSGDISTHSNLSAEFLEIVPGLLDMSLEDPVVPGIIEQLENISLTDIFEVYVVDDLDANFSVNSILSSLETFLDNLDTTFGDFDISVDNVNGQIVPISGAEYELLITMTVSVTSTREYKFDLGRNADLLALAYDPEEMPDVELEVGFEIDTTFGCVVDLTEGDYDLGGVNNDTKVEAVDGDFFVRDTTVSAIARVIENDMDFGQGVGEFQVGFLEIEVENGIFNLMANMSAPLEDPNNASGTNRITLSELTGSSTETLMGNVVKDGNFSASLPVNVKTLGVSSFDSVFSGFSLEISFPQSDPFSSSYHPDGSDDPRTAPPISLSQDFEDYLLPFKNILPDGFLGLMEQLKGWLGSFGVSQIFSAVDIPFADRHTLADVLDFFSGMNALLSHSAIAITDEDGITTPQFVSAQNLATNLTVALGMSMVNLNPTYDNETYELTYKIELNPVLPPILEVPIDFNMDLGPLGNIYTNVEVSLNPYVSLDLTIGIDLKTETEIGISPKISDLALRALINPSTGNSYTPSNGQLSENIKFKLTLGSLGSVDVNVTAGNTSGNSNVSDLADDIEPVIEYMLNLKNIEAEVQVEVLTGDRLSISSYDTSFIKIQNNSYNATESAGGFELLGFWDGQIAYTSPLPRNGVLSGTASFDLTVGQVTKSINILQDTANADPGDDPINRLISDIGYEIDSEYTNDEIVVKHVGDTFEILLNPTKDEKFLRVTDPNDVAVQELGLEDDMIGAELVILGDRSLFITATNKLMGKVLQNGTLQENASITLEIDGEEVTFTVNAANLIVLGFRCNSYAWGELMACKELDDTANGSYGPKPGVDITFRLTIGNESYIVSVPKSETDDNSDIDDMIIDMNAAFQNVIAENGSMVDISSKVTAGKDASGKKLTLTPYPPSTFIRISSVGTTQDNEELLDLVDDINEALARERLSDGTRLDRVVVAGVIGNDTNDPPDGIPDDFYLTLSIPSALKDTLNITAFSTSDLGFQITYQTVYGPRSNGKLSDDAEFTLTLDEGTGPESYNVTVTKSSTDSNTYITDLIEDINSALSSVTPSGGGSPVDISDKVVAGLIGYRLALYAVDKNATLLKTTAPDSEAENELGLDDGVTAIARETKGRLFIRDASFSGGVNLVVNTIDDPALSAHFGFVGIEVNMIKGTLFSYGTNVAIHGEAAIDVGGIVTKEISTYRLIHDTKFQLSLCDDIPRSVTLYAGLTFFNNDIYDLAIDLWVAINSSIGIGNVIVSVDGSTIILSTPNGERLRVSLDQPNYEAEEIFGFATGQQTGRIYLSDLAKAITNFEILDALIDVNISGSGRLNLSDIEIQLEGVVDGLLEQLGVDARIVLTLSDFTNISTLNISGLDMGAIADGFDDLNFSSVLDGIESILSLLQNFDMFDFLDEPLPIIGVNLSEALNYIEDFLDFLDDLENNPAAIVQDLDQLLKEALGLPPNSNAVSLSLDTSSSDILRINFSFNTSYSGSLPVFIDLVNLLGITMPPGLGDLMNLSGAAGLEAEFQAGIEVGLGIDIEDLTVYIYDNTGLGLTGYVAGTNVTFVAALGPFGLFVSGGAVVFNEDGDTNNTTPAYFILSAFNDPDPGTEGDKVILTNIAPQASLSAGLGAILPCYFPIASNFIGNLDFEVGISMAVGTSDPFDINVSANLNSAPDFTALPDLGDLNLIDSLHLAVEGLDLLLAILENLLGGELGSLDLPLIGDGLSNGAEFIEEVRGSVIPELRDLIDNAPQKAIGFVQKAIFNALGPPGLNVLVLDPNWDNNSAKTYKDVQYIFNDTVLQFNLWLGGQYNFSIPEFEFGLPGLGIDMDGEIIVSLDWNLLLCFGLSLEDGFYFDVTPWDEFTDHLDGNPNPPMLDGQPLEHVFNINLSVTLMEKLTGELLFLQLDIENRDVTMEDPDKSSLVAFFIVDVESSGGNDRLSFSKIPSMDLNFSFGVEVDVDLNLTLGIAGGGGKWPSIVSEFYLRWGLGDGVNNGSSDPLENHSAIPWISFNNVGLNLGSFFSDFLGPIIEEVQRVTEPLEDLIDILISPIPVISDLAGDDISLLDIAGKFGFVDPGFIEALADLITLINSIPTDAGDIIIYFGNFSVGGDGTLDLRDEDALRIIRESSSSANLSQIIKDNYGNDFGTLPDIMDSFEFDSVLDGALSSSGASPGTKSFAKSATKDAGGFKFPIFTDPGQIFGLLMGRPADVFVYDMPPLIFDFSYSQFFPIWDGLGAEISGSIGVIIDLSFGYDTYGIQKFAEGGYRHPLDLLKGFYIGDLDLETGADIPEITVYGSLTGAAVLNIFVASVGVGGGIYATVYFNLNDPDGDGKVRIEEILGNIENGFRQLGIPLGLICIFDVSGKVWARLFAFVKIKLLFFKFEKTWYFGPSVPLLEFSYSCPWDPVLATKVGNDELRINVGKYAGDRLYGDIRDGDEEIHVKLKPGTDDTVYVWAPSLGVGPGDRQEYTGVRKIVANAGEGHDKIDTSGVTTSSITAELKGESGNDVLIAGAGAAEINGGLGDDVLIGGDGNDDIYGEKGNDMIIGNGGDDLVEGGLGDDILNGDAQLSDGEPHTLRGPPGEDIVLGGSGNDLLAGGGESDVLRGGEGKDRIWGDRAFQFTKVTDWIYELNVNGNGNPVMVDVGTAGGDHITGDEDADEIKGRGGNDLISGGGGPDYIEGGGGADKIWGDSNFKFIDNVLQMDGSDPKTIFPLYGTAAGDTILGGNGGDYIYGEDGNDKIWGDGGQDFLYGDRGADVIYGGDGNDELYGWTGNDIMYGNDGNDLLKGEGDNDVMFGDDGEVTIVPGKPTLNYDLIRTINPGTGGDDTMDGSDGGDIMLGGPGGDTMNGSTGDDVLLGDNGRLDYTYQSSIDASLIDLIESTDHNSGDVDHIYGYEGDDFIIGGIEGDIIFGDSNVPGVSGKDIVIGDNGKIDFVPNPGIKSSEVSFIETTDTVVGTGGDDEIDGSEEADILLGGVGEDELIGGLDDDIIIGDSGELDYDTGDGDLSTLDLIRTTDNIIPVDGDSDDISGGEANDIVFGGDDDDLIFGDKALNYSASADPGEDILIGDQGELVFENGLIARIETTDTGSAYGGVDTIEGNEEDDIVIGGVEGDNLEGNDCYDILIGDEGRLKYNVAIIAGGDGDPATLDIIETIRPTLGGSDDIEGNDCDDIILGGAAGDDIWGHADDDIVLGDNGKITLSGGVIEEIKTTDPTDGGSDTIEGNGAADIILGGAYGDDIWGHAGDDIILGDNGMITLSGGVIEEIKTTDPTDGGSDTIEGNDGADILLGGAYGDDIWGHTGEDVILGDNGKITQPGGVIELIETTDPGDGGSDTIEGNEEADIIMGGAYGDDIWGNASDDYILGDNGKITMPGEVVELIETTDPAIGGSDTIEGNSGDDIILGGAYGDDIWGHDGEDVILGDNGKITMPGEVIDLIETTDPAIGGDDTIRGNEEDDIILGGAESDDIWGHTGNDVILGDNGKVTQPDEVIEQIETTDPAIGGNDTIRGNEGRDFILGGAYHDDIWGHEGEDVILGDNGYLNFVMDADPNTLDLIVTTDPAIGGNDTIEGNEDADQILGGTASDDIWGHEGNDFILGDNGNFTQPGEIIEYIKTTAPGIGGSDTIYGNEGNDSIWGGADGDYIEGNDGLDIILGDNGLFSYVELSVDGATPDPATLDLVTSTFPNDGGSDTISGGADNDIVMGGTASDTIYGNDGNDLIFGDHGKVERVVGSTIDLTTIPIPSFTFTSIFTGAGDGGDGDLIHGNAGDDIILGGQGDDNIFGDAGDDDLIGGHNVEGGADELDTPAGLNDIMDGGSGDDVLAGDNAEILRRPDTISPRFRALDGKALYDSNGDADVTGTHQPNPSGAQGRDIFLFDHSHNPIPDSFGDDFMAGGPDEDVMFGQLGDDIMQGDASITEVVNATDPSVEGVDDDDDYIEGNGGKDLIFGNLGQDDILGGSSALFGLTNSSLRPDDEDIIFGGAGTRLARNDPGNETDDGHAADSDYIVGDNANIFRIVGINGKDSGQFLTFTYDSYGNLTVIPRAADMLDYTPGGSPNDIGDDDLIHGEAGDDFIYGMLGNDVLFGEGQDDDIYGQAGHDRIYGGLGEDGILGDDGKIFTSRNGEKEALYGINNVNREKFIKIPGPFTGAWVNIEGRLKKEVDLAAFEYGGNDIIYGGLGDDWLHGGAGDDAISGAEALPEFYNSDPVTNTTPIPYDPVTRKLFFYDAENPRTKIDGFFLNFEATDGNGTKINDGKDRLFGDNGHDWLVGGTMNDRHFGGLGDDVINADDNHDSQGGLNNQPDDPEFADRDFSFGGAGLDVLIFNTGGDRSFDWIGEFNSYIAPYAPFGNPEVVREISPHLVKFLLNLGEACGADQTLIESDGELGLADQHDSRYGDQHGQPRDPQAGNLPGVHRDTLGEPEDDREP